MWKNPNTVHTTHKREYIKEEGEVITIFLDVVLGHHPSGLPVNTHPNRNKHVVLPILAINTNGLQCLCHSGAVPKQFRRSIGKSGQARITKTHKIMIHPEPLILPVLLWSPLLDDEGMNTSPLGKGSNTKVCRRIEESFEGPKLW